MKPTFNTKEDYLTWRAEWRARYNEISTDIRDLKIAIRAFQSGIEKSKWDLARARIVDTINRHTNKNTGNFQSWNIHKLKSEATQMLEWRKESKLRAQDQYQSAKNGGLVSDHG